LSSANFETLVSRLASVCPARGLASSLDGRFSSLLKNARIYLPPSVYSRFSLSLFVYPIFGEVLALFAPRPQAFFILASLGLIQVVPLLLPLTLAHTRQRSVDAELPFFLIFLSIFSRDSSPSIDDGLRKVAALGDDVFPAFRGEAAIMERDLTFFPGAPADIIERAFAAHPSKSLRQFIHGLMITLTTGKSVVEFVDEESRSPSVRSLRCLSWSSRCSPWGSTWPPRPSRGWRPRRSSWCPWQYSASSQPSCSC
jgi:hypothetical protein